MDTDPPASATHLPADAPSDHRLLNSAELRRLLSVGRTTFYRVIHQPGFPPPLRLLADGDFLWWSHEVSAWLETRRAAEPHGERPSTNCLAESMTRAH